MSSNLGKCGVFEIIRVALLILRLDVIQGNLEENLIACCRAGDLFLASLLDIEKIEQLCGCKI